MKTSQELQQEVNDLQKLVEKLKRQLKAALASNVQMKDRAAPGRHSTN